MGMCHVMALEWDITVAWKSQDCNIHNNGWQCV